MKYVTIINDRKYEIDIDRDGAIRVNGQERTVDFLPLSGALYSLLTNNRSHEVLVEEHDEEVEVILRGRRYGAVVMDERALLLAQTRGDLGDASGEVVVKAPMPGLVVALPFAEGAEVRKGQTVLILESMKMQNELKAPKDGTLTRVHVSQGQSVEQNKPLLTIV